MNMKSKSEVVSCLSKPLCICDSTLPSGSGSRQREQFSRTSKNTGSPSFWTTRECPR